METQPPDASEPGIRLMIARNESPHSPLVFNSLQWICSCMSGKENIDQAGIRLEAINIWRLLHESAESQVRRGWYSVRSPQLVRLANQKNNKLQNVLQFQKTGVLDDVTGLYSCKIYLKLNNTSWRLSPCDCSFIEGRGPCAVTMYLYDFCRVGPIPPPVGLLSWATGFFV